MQRSLEVSRGPVARTGSGARSQRHRLAAAAVACTLGLTACGANTPVADIVLVDYTIGAPTSLTAGTTRLEVLVKGVAHHTLTMCESEQLGVCDGERVVQRMVRRPKDARDQSLIPDESTHLVLGAGWDAAVDVDLQPGTYRIYCQIVNHAGYGMDRLIEVVPADA